MKKKKSFCQSMIITLDIFIFVWFFLSLSDEYKPELLKKITETWQYSTSLSLVLPVTSHVLPPSPFFFILISRITDVTLPFYCKKSSLTLSHFVDFHFFFCRFLFVGLKKTDKCVNSYRLFAFSHLCNNHRSLEWKLINA